MGEKIAKEFLRKDGYEVQEFWRDLYLVLFNDNGRERKQRKKDYDLFKIDSKQARDSYRLTHYNTPNSKFDKTELWDKFYSIEENVESYKQYRKNVIESYNEVKELLAFIGDFENFEQYVKELNIGQYDITKDTGGPSLYIPDLVAKKNNKIYIVEVKANTGVRQIRNLNEASIIAKKYGFIPILMTLNVNIEATNLTFREL
jgi:hypothetical protein